MVNGCMSRWRAGVPQGPGIPALEYFNQVYTDSGIKCTLSMKEGMPNKENWTNSRSGLKTCPSTLLLQIPPGVLNPALGSLAQERCESAGLTPEEVHKDDWGAEAPLL